MTTSSIRAKVEEYFTSINSTANRLMADVESIKQRKGDSWNKLSYNEQSDLLWKSLVNTEVEDKYQRHPRYTSEVDYFPVLRIRPGEKIVVDDESANSRSGRPFGCSWRDEHSAPFTWETQSQLDLRLFECQTKPELPLPERIVKPGLSTPDQSERVITKSRTLPTPEQSEKIITRSRLPTPDPSGPRTPTSHSNSMIRPKKAPPPPPVDYTLNKNTKQDRKDANETPRSESYEPSPGERNTIPKTGFDFLDNW